MKSALNPPSNVPVHFVHTQALQLEQAAHIVLSPYYYWVKKADFEISSLKQARKIASSLFESEIPAGDYTYEVYTLNEQTLFICYDREAILKSLAKLGISLNLIKSLSLAQYHLDTLQAPLLFGDKALLLVDDIVTLVPKAYMRTSTPNILLEVDTYLNKEFSKRNSIAIGNFFGVDIEAFKRSLIAIALLMTFLLGSQYYLLATQENELERAIESIKEKYHLPSTMVQLSSMQSTLSKLQKEQDLIRETLYVITQQRQLINGTLSAISASTKHITFTFSQKNVALQEKLKSELPKATFKERDSGFIMEVLP